MISETRYARASDGVHIAYRIMGSGPIALIVDLGFLGHVEFAVKEPRIFGMFESFSRFARVIVYDRRGVGLSDAGDRASTLEDQTEDIRALMDAESIESAALFGFTISAPSALLFAAAEPDRVSHLVISSGLAKATRSDDYPYGNDPATREVLNKLSTEHWGEGLRVVAGMPSLAGDEEFRAWAAALERHALSPGAAMKYFSLVGDIDVRAVLPSVHQPALVLHPEASTTIEAGHSRYLARELPNARYVSLPGADLIPVTPEARDVMISNVEEFLTGERPSHLPDRALRTMLFTDIVDSTATAARLGDREWHQVLDQHDTAVNREIVAHRGKLVKSTGDGAFATFDGPEKAIRCALAINQSVTPTGLAVRAGVHTGECELRGADLAGIAVHIGARVAAAADPNETLISQTVKDLIVGSDLTVVPRGSHELKGVPDLWELFAVS
ncbi:MAG: adenylate/guanylate cyclase domain-containing protein [Thermoleophilaceae bacterium]|nr:adenylate/guanylate cyclase domain-containing protein [Thermoleophilaceae bacterium]